MQKANLNKKTTSHHIKGLWFHITWENEYRGTDQHNTVWYNQANPTCSHPFIPVLCELSHALLTNSRYFTGRKEGEVYAELETEENNSYKQRREVA